MTTVSVIYFSGYGHTAKQAESVFRGVTEVGGVSAHLIAVDKEGTIRDEEWETLVASDAVLFGTPTYMGGPAWQFKKFMDATSHKIFAKRAWLDKVAGGFTNSASINGDKAATINALSTFALQHGMVWVGTGLPPANLKATQRNEVNWLGGFAGALAQSPADSSAEEGPLPGDLETARLFGQRIANYTKRTTLLHIA